MPRSILLLLVAVVAFAGCSSSDDPDKPDGAWAMTLCERVTKETLDTPSQGPLPYDLLDARAVTEKEAKALGEGFLPTSGSTKYAASCKIRFRQPYNGTIRDGAALLAFEGGSNSFVVDPHWAE